jgi:hypothetical protein
MAASDSENRTRSLPAAAALCLALVGAASMLYYHEWIFMPGVKAVRAATGLGHGYSFGNDFYQVWLTARKCVPERCDAYSPETTREIQMGLYGRLLDSRIPTDPVDRRIFPYPAFTDLLFWPASQLPFQVVRVALVPILTALAVATILIWLRAFAWHLRWPWIAALILLVLTSYPALEGLYAGQLGLIVGFLLASTVLALQRGQLTLAGVLLALSTIKPQTTVLVILYFLLWSLQDWPRRRRFWAGMFSTMLLLMGTSLAVWPHWIISWLNTLVAYHGYTTPPLVKEILLAPLGTYATGVARLITAVFVVVALVLSWRNRHAPVGSIQFWRTLSLLLAITTIAILPGQAVYDHLILLPGILLLMRYWRELRGSGRVPRILMTVGAIVLFWPWAAAFVLIVVRPLLSAQYFFSRAVFYLPIRTAASIPFAVLALLVYARRIKLNESREAS